MKRVLVAMSGGVDSSVAALLLHRQGYDIVGITMKTYDYDEGGGVANETACCSVESINDARTLAVGLGFPHYIIDIRDEFEDKVIDNFIDEYMAGRTPNPCVLCNKHIKWEALLRRADQLGCDFIATGHYARISYENNRYFISQGIDAVKDQAYMLWGLSQESLSRTILPLGDYNKSEIKQLAAENGFVDLARKRESYEICFIPDNDYRGYLRRKVADIDKKIGKGNFVLSDGTIVGQHNGYPFYTIGQRKGLNIALGYPAFVLAMDAETNMITLGKKDELLSNKLIVTNYTLSKYGQIPEKLDVKTKIRYKDGGTNSRIWEKDDKIYVEFYEDVSAITPGQSAVFYENGDVIGGGIIAEIKG